MFTFNFYCAMSADLLTARSKWRLDGLVLSGQCCIHLSTQCNFMQMFTNNIYSDNCSVTFYQSNMLYIDNHLPVVKETLFVHFAFHGTSAFLLPYFFYIFDHSKYSITPYFFQNNYFFVLLNIYTHVINIKVASRSTFHGLSTPGRCAMFRDANNH